MLQKLANNIDYSELQCIENPACPCCQDLDNLEWTVIQQPSYDDMKVTLTVGELIKIITDVCENGYTQLEIPVAMEPMTVQSMLDKMKETMKKETVEAVKKLAHKK